MDFYFDCAWGISGDMTVAALLDIGADFETLCAELCKIPMGGYTLSYTKVERDGRISSDFDVVLDPASRDNQIQRNYYDVLELVTGSGLRPGVKELSRKMLTVAATSQAKAHGVPLSEVFFHETGAVDSIIDIVGTAVCLDGLGAAHIYASPLSEGRGTVECRYGKLTVPVPATKNTLIGHGIPFRIIDVDGELITPTGAAIAAVLFDDFRTREQLEQKGHSFLKRGVGAGKRAYGKGGFLTCYALG